MKRNFPEIFKDLRQEKNFTQVELAQRLNYTQGNISGWENGSVEPKATAIIKCSEFFDVSADYLLGLEDDFGARTTITSNSTSENLSTEERQLIEEYRKLPKTSKELVLRMVGITEKKNV
jgi:transcriptional regulator with XRE-family HTH domain